MADINQLYDALRKADAAGNTADAQALAQAIKTQNTPAAPPQAAPADTSQPSIMDRIVASPIGRLGQENIVAPALGIGTFLAKHTMSDDPRVDTLQNAETGAYEGALARNRNTPGYAAARETANKVASRMNTPGQNATDTVFKSFQAPIAGVAGLVEGGGDLDTSNAMADATSARLDAVQARHPYLSAGAQLLGGIATGAPELVPAQSASKVPAVVTSALNPAIPQKAAQGAVDYVSTLAQSAGKTPDQIALAANEFGGKPVTAAEAIGRPGVGALAALGRRSGATPDALEGALAARTMAAPSRVLGDFADTLGISPQAAQGNVDSLIEAGKTKAAPLYEEAYKANPNVSSPEIDRVLTTPAGKQALSSARQMMQNDMTLMGVKDPELLAQAKEAGQKLPFKGGVSSGLKLQTFDYIKRALDDQIGAAFRAGNKQEGSVLVGLKSRLVNALDNADVTGMAGPNSLRPEGGKYAQARRAAGEYLDAQQQFENGKSALFDANLGTKDIIDSVGKMSAPGLEAFKGGVANRIYMMAQNGRLRPAALNAPAIREKLSVLFGADKAATFIARAQAEAKLAATGSRMKPGLGSPTAELAEAMGEQDTGVNLPGMISAGKAGMHAVHGNGLGAVTNAMDAIRHFSPKVGMMSVPVRDEAGRLLMMHPKDLADYLKSLSAQPLIQALPSPPAPYGLLGPSVSAAQQTGLLPQQ